MQAYQNLETTPVRMLNQSINVVLLHHHKSDVEPHLNRLKIASALALPRNRLHKSLSVSPFGCGVHVPSKGAFETCRPCIPLDETRNLVVSTPY